ncbi:MAG: ribonuclease HI [Candidatus Aminicenantes bacterium]|nr:ribonuclease HI [Candidatus Aminicenantes bacterium]
MGKNKKKFYAVACGRETGIYMEWFGENGAEAQVKEFPGARHMKFSNLSDAQEWLAACGKSKPVKTGKTKPKDDIFGEKIDVEQALKEGKVIIYTDGGCINNPGPGGYGVVQLYKGQSKDEPTRKELSGGFRYTTNNRMELLACIEGLKALKYTCPVILFSDSQYVVKGIMKGWARRWKSKGWMRTKEDAAENADLWVQLLELCDKIRVKFFWVKGHSGNPENERCDELATRSATDIDNQSRDSAYENGQTTVSGPKLLFPQGE